MHINPVGTSSYNVPFRGYYKTDMAEELLQRTLTEEKAQKKFKEIKDYFVKYPDSLFLSAQDKELLQIDVYYGKNTRIPYTIQQQRDDETTSDFISRVHTRLFENGFCK